VAAGLVFAAAGVEVLPDVLQRDLPLAAAAGFAAGVGLMLAIRTLSRHGETEDGIGPARTLIGVIVIDIFIDGLLIGVSYAAGDRGHQTLLISIAIGAELMALGLSLSGRLGKRGIRPRRSIGTACLVALAPPLGAAAGFILGGALADAWLESTLAFAVAALLYLATEELLKDAHEVPETPLATTLFFAAFLALLLIDMVSPG